MTAPTLERPACTCGAQEFAAEPPPAPQPAVAPVEEAAPITNPVRWRGALAMENEVTGDMPRRVFKPNALRWDDAEALPLSIVRLAAGGHDNSVVVGSIEEIVRQPGGVIFGRGDFDMGSPDGIEAERLVREGRMNWASVDLDDVELEVWVLKDLLAAEEEGLGMLLAAAGDPMPSADDYETVMEITPDDEIHVIRSGRIRGATLVHISAFAQAKIEIDAEDAVAPEVVVAGGTVPIDYGYASTSDSNRAAVLVEGRQARPGGMLAVDRREVGATEEPDGAVRPTRFIGEASAGGAPLGLPTADRADPSRADGGSPVREHSVPERRAPGGRDLRREHPAAVGSPVATNGVPTRTPGHRCEHVLEMHPSTRRLGQDVSDVRSLQAGGFPAAPPSAWFSNPGLTEPTPLVVMDDGRIYGHLATFGQCHVAYSDQCVQPPHSAADYAYFNTGSVLTADGGQVSTGVITLDTNHAAPPLSPANTLAHYENTGWGVADVHAGEDQFGVWIAGALRPGVTAAQVRRLRASPLSGDWRRIGGSLELVAALAVNVPGFPIPKPKALVASGRVVSLVAAGMEPTTRVDAPEEVARMATRLKVARMARQLSAVS